MPDEKIHPDEKSPRLRLAIQKSGRLSDGTIELLKNCGLSISRGRDKLYGRIEEMPIDLLLLRDDDIPAFVSDGACDIGIVGENVAQEERLTVQREAHAVKVKALGFSKCRLMIAGPKEWHYTGSEMLSKRRIATSYPGLTQEYLDANEIDATSVMMKGSVEVAPRLRIADAVCDIVFFDSEAILIRNEKKFNTGKQEIFDAFLKRIDGVMRSRHAKYVMMNAPREAVDKITKILPGVDAPTILELAGKSDMVAVHAVCPESVFWDTLEALKAIGASGILVLNIEKMMP